jgi:hypothetical protein
LKENVGKKFAVFKPPKFSLFGTFELEIAFDILNCACGLPVGTGQNALQFLAM